MKISVRVLEGGKIFEGEALLREVSPEEAPRPGRLRGLKPTAAVRPSAAVDTLYHQGFFATERTLGSVINELKSGGYNFSSPSILMALKARDYLQRRGSKGSYRFVQKYPSVGG
jgi:hypothetical protein